MNNIQNPQMDVVGDHARIEDGIHFGEKKKPC